MNRLLQLTGVVVEVRHQFCRPVHKSLPVFRNRNMTQSIEAESLINKEPTVDLAERQFLILLQAKRPRRMMPWKRLGKAVGMQCKPKVLYH
jgi:hypothetical protein